MTDLLTLLRKIGDAGPDGYQPRANTPGTAPAVAAALNTAKGATFEAAQHARRRKGAPPK